MSNSNLDSFTDFLEDEIAYSQESQPLSFSSENSQKCKEFSSHNNEVQYPQPCRPAKGTGQYGQFRSIDEIDEKYRDVFSYPFFNVVQSSVIDDALYSDKSMVVCAPTGSGKTVVFEMAIVQLLMELEDKQCTDDFKIIYMAPVKALCTERLTEWYPKFTKLGLMCIEVTGDTDVDFSQLKPYRIIITTPEKWDMVTRRWREHRQLVEVIKLFLIDEVHILNDETRGPVLEAVVSRMKTIEASAQSAHRIEQLQKQYQNTEENVTEVPGSNKPDQNPPMIRFVAVSATVSNPEDVAAWLGNAHKPAVYYKFGDESRPVKLKRVVEGYPCPEGTSIFKFDIILNYKLWPVIQKYHNGKPTLIFCNTRKSVALTAETLSRELTVSFNPEQKAKLTALASTIKNKKLQTLVLSGVGCHHAGLLYEERTNIERAFRNRDLPILITTTTLAMGVNLPAHLVIIKNTQQYVNGAYQEYSISTVLQMVGRAGRPQFDTEATAVIMTRLCDKPRYQALVGGSEPLQSYLHRRLPENLNSEAAMGTVNDVAQCVQWLRSTFLCVRAARDPKRYLGLSQAAPHQLISKKIEELCVKAMNSLATYGLITMDEASCIESTEAGRLMSVYYLDLETMKHIMKINGTETLEKLLWIICESHELADMHLRVDERRCLNSLNRNNAAATIRFPMKGKISTRQMKLNCIIQAILGCLSIPDPSLSQESTKIMRIADRVCKCLVAYVSRPALVSQQPQFYCAVLNALILAKCVTAHLWENSAYVSKQLKGIGPTFSTLLATAGKVNFMLLEESHPRDLERIMNKGPPAGNILRKQISLLPKYQLIMTPVDEKSVTIQLTLLNQNHLSENMEQLTAGDNHKSYIVVGDSENNLLLLTSFKDKDLISVYDGVITHKIIRKNSFEHKMFAHCISTSFVGIDAQCEYLFKDLQGTPPNLAMVEEFMKKPVTKQTSITDTFKERKRKNTSECDITQSKEKKKRDNALLQKLKTLKESFGKTSKDLKEDLDKSAIISKKILQDLTEFENPKTTINLVSESTEKNPRIEPSNYNFPTEQNKNDSELVDTIDSDEFMDDEKINNILNEIENEISKGKREPESPKVELTKNLQNKKSFYSATTSIKAHELPSIGFGTNINKQTNDIPNIGATLLSNITTIKLNEKNEAHKTINSMKKYLTQRHSRTKNNFNFIGLQNKGMNLSDEEVEVEDNRYNGFSTAIKSQLEKYLRKTKNVTQIPDKTITDILTIEENNKNEEDECETNSNYVTQHMNETQLTENNSTDYEQENKNNESHINTEENCSNTNIVEYSQEPSQLSVNWLKKQDKTMKNVIDSQYLDTVDTKKIEVRKHNYCYDEETKSNLDNSSTTPMSTTSTNCMSSILNTKNHNNTEQYQIYFETRNQDDNVVSKTYNNKMLSLAKSFCDNSEKENTKNLNLIKYKPLTCQLSEISYVENETPQSPFQIFPESIKGHTITRNYSMNNSETLNTLVREQYGVSKRESDSSQYYSNNQKTNHDRANIRNYSYSATKIDVAAKDNDITIIRKITMDLSITEIIAKREKDKRLNTQIGDTIKKPDIRQCIENHNMNLGLGKDDVNMSALNIIKYQLMPKYKEVEEPLNNTQNPETKCIGWETRHGRVEDIDNNDRKNLESNLTRKDTEKIQQNNRHTVVASLNQGETNSKSQNKQTEHRTNNSFKQVEHFGNELSFTNEIPQKEGKKIENIFQKYSNILRKDDRSLIQCPMQPKNRNDYTVSNTQTEKPQRPFKIREIQNLKTSLPKLMINSTPNRENFLSVEDPPTVDNAISDTQNLVNIGNHIEQIKNRTYQQTEEPEVVNTLLPRPMQVCGDTNYSNIDVQNQVPNSIDLECSNFDTNHNAIDDNEPQRTGADINIDQDMFNPKTLLQCFCQTKPEVVVPPPPEFCDESELITPIDNDDTVPMDCYEPVLWDNIESNSILNQESIFQDDSHIELTPRKEIETWAFSESEESPQSIATSAGMKSRQCFTIMHTPRQRTIPFQNVSVNKQSRLGQFKFCRKNKLHPKP